MKILRSPIYEEANPDSAGASGGGSTEGSSLSTPTIPSLSETGNTSTPAPTDWKSALNVSDEIKGWKGFENIKDPSDAVEQLYNSQKLIGMDKIVKPQADWTDEQWNAHYNEMGRPEAPDKYTMPEFSTEVAQYLTPEVTDVYKGVFHEAGLDQKQVDKIMTGYEKIQAEQMAQANLKRQQAAQESMTQLVSEYGDNFEGKMDIAKAAAQKYGLGDVLKEAGLDQNAQVIRAFMAIGETVMESSTKTGGSPMQIGNAAQAQVALNQFKANPEKIKALHNPSDPANAAVKEEWAKLHLLAYPPES